MKPKPQSKPSLKNQNYFYLVFSVLLLVSFSSCQTQQNEKSNEDSSETANTLRPNLDNEDERTALLENDALNSSTNFAQNKNKDESKRTFSDDELDSFSSADSATFFSRFAPKTQTFKIINNGEQDIFCDLGTYIHIDSGSFHFKDGSPITEPIIFEVKEFYDKSTVLLSGLTTNTKGGFLESGGMLHLKSTSDGKEVHLKNKIDIEMPSINTQKRNKNGMSVYLTSSTNATANSVSNPPSEWSDTKEKIKLQRIPRKRDFYKTVFLFNKELPDYELSGVKDCECGDVQIVSETVEALSENLDVTTSKEHESSFRKVNHRKVTTKNKVLKNSYYYNKKQFLSKDTSFLELYSKVSREIYPNNEGEERYVYDTIQLAVELGKKGTALIVDELYQTNHSLSQTSFIRTVNSGSGLRFTTQLSSIRSCSQDKRNFYVQSLDIWKEILEQGENEFRNWKKTQRDSEENYTISYKKRKNPILVWTAIVKTTAKPFKEDVQVVRRREFFYKKALEEKQARYNEFRQSIIDSYNAIAAKNVNNVSTATLETYIMRVSDMGWINCDRFYSVPDDEKVDLLVNSSSPVRIIFNNINSVMKGDNREGKNIFASIPKDESITVFGIRKKEDKLFMALKNTKVSTDPIDLEYKEVTFEEMQKALTYLN
ncbi:hypothetical protein [Bernardetia sp. MNP-M8]|uniref:hypothetical protein n=1 Tax=Bernardetia sp. MNP-M8 TaxID=3127470 RepID=UPI0030CBD749